MAVVSCRGRDSEARTAVAERSGPSAHSSDLAASETGRPALAATGNAPTGQPDGQGHAAVSHLPSATVNQPFTPPREHSRIAADAPAADARGIYAQRSHDPSAPAIAIAGSSWLKGRPLQVLDEPLAVRVDPAAVVVWYATALGTFANGRHDVSVTADDQGIARVFFQSGQDAGDYQVIAVSPSRSGVATFTISIAR